MAETTRMALPLLEAGQTQKHVTVNEALTRLDALAAGVVASRALSDPPPGPVEGLAYLVAGEGGGAWAGRGGQIAFFDNGGWSFARPWDGQRVWVADEGQAVVFVVGAWRAGIGVSESGAATVARVVSIDHVVGAGGASATPAFIPDKAVVIGVTARVTETLTGDGLTGWRLGVADDPARYGAGYGVAAGSFAHGVTGAPLAYYGGTEMVLSPEGGAFTGGRVRLAAHLLTLEPPAPA
ncbi:MAG: DUF2793 domain-containing protein [Rhodobacteraceae bacterium]|nr:MAG: DUF2793 domain-containing protein [Paracoccaceae bacterium]